MREYSSQDGVYGNFDTILIVFSQLEHQDLYPEFCDNIFFQFDEMEIDR